MAKIKPKDQCCYNCGDRLSQCSCGITETYMDEEGPICPYCGSVNRACDSDGILYDESTTETDCGSCGKIFGVGICVSFSWSARTKESTADE